MCRNPGSEAVLASLPPGEEAIVAPLLLSEGFHTSVDIAEAVATRALTRTAAPIGPDPRMAEVLAQRLAEAGHRPGDAVVLAAAGTRIEAGAAAGRPDGRTPGRIHGPAGHRGVLLGGHAVGARGGRRRARRRGRRVGIASFLLAPGFFHDRLAGAGADYVSGALLPSVTIAKCVAGRLAEALAEGSSGTE